MTELASPEKVQRLLKRPDFFIEAQRLVAKNIVQGKEERIALIVGPCSIHDPISAVEYAQKLQELQSQVADVFFLVMRVFLEKPRTRFGWKGFITDPFLDHSFQMQKGILEARKLLIQINECKVPCATEFLNPVVFQYIHDLITWGVIGSRTSSSPIHRELASLASFPIGFKNDLVGNLDPAIDGILASGAPQSHFNIHASGKIRPLFSSGNPYAHLILRGAKTFTNFDSISVRQAKERLDIESITTKIMVDCSHGNSKKDPQNQKISFSSAISQINSFSPICALMLESFLFPGSQPILPDPSKLLYGISVTDSCLGWDETKELILKAHQQLQDKKI